MPIRYVSKEDIMEQISRRKTIVFYLQVAAAVVSLMIGMFNLTKESKPIVERIQENHRQNLLVKQQQEIVKRATQIAHMPIQWQYRNNDGTWRYYSDETGRYWCRVNIQGIYEYSENPQYQQNHQIAGLPNIIK
jgi:hypothetical protein